MKPNDIRVWLILAGIFVIILWIIFGMIPTDTQHNIQTRSIVGFFALILGLIIALIRQRQIKK
jgi:uncharacterized membrane protein SirB2